MRHSVDAIFNRIKKEVENFFTQLNKDQDNNNLPTTKKARLATLLFCFV
jgi:hypothetical protein